MLDCKNEEISKSVHVNVRNLGNIVLLRLIKSSVDRGDRRFFVSSRRW